MFVAPSIYVNANGDYAMNAEEKMKAAWSALSVEKQKAEMRLTNLLRDYDKANAEYLKTLPHNSDKSLRDLMFRKNCVMKVSVTRG